MYSRGRQILFLLLWTGCTAIASAQTFPFNTWTSGSFSYTRTVAGNTMTVNYSESGNYRGNTQAYTECYGYNTSVYPVPFFYNASTMNVANYSTSSCYCGSSAAQSGLVLAANWPNQVQHWEQLDISFATPVCGPVRFNIWDINQDNGGGPGSIYFTDKVDISATDGNLAEVPAAGIVIGSCGSNTVTTSGNVKTITGVLNGCSCQSTSITINSGTVKTIRIRYWNGGSTNSSDPQSQYIVITSIVASPPPTASITAAPLTCGSVTTTLTANTNASSPTYQWTGPGGSTIVSPNSASTQVTGAGTYTLTINPGGCSATATYNLTPSGTPPNLTAAANQTITCTSTTLSAASTTPGVTFSWTGPGIVNGGNTATPTVNAAGNYTVTVTNPTNGCVNSLPVVVALNNSPPNANAGPGGSISCATSTLVLSGSSSTPGVTYAWSGPGIVSGGNTATPTVNAAGTYTLTVTNPTNGCTANSQAIVTGNTTPPNANAGPNRTLTCTSATAILNGSSTTPGATHAWSGPGIVSGGNTATPTVNAVGTYTLTVTNPANGCTATSSANVTQNTTPPNANAGPDRTLTCTATTATLNGSSTTPGVTYSWSGLGIVSGGNTATPTVNAVGTYTLTVTNLSNGCTTTAQANVTQNITPPNANAGPDRTLTCTATTATLNGSSTTPGITYSWSGPGIVSGGNTATPTVNAVGTYILTVTNPTNGCTAIAQADVTQVATPPNVDAGPDRSLTCTATTAILNGSSTTPGVTYSWSGPGIVSGGNTANPTVNAAGTYTLTVTDPANGCSNTDQAVVTSTADIPNANAGPDRTLTCTATTATLNGSSTTPGVTYSWSGPGIVSGGNTATPTVNAVGAYILTVTNPSNGCNATAQANVTQNTTPPNVDAGPDRILTCTATTAILNGSSTTPGVMYSWSGPGIVSVGTMATTIVVNAVGTYTLTVTSPANGCTATSQANVTQNTTPPNANAGPDRVLTCTATTNTLNGSSTTPGVTYSWSGPGIVSGGNTATPTVNAVGTYILTVTNPSNSCTATAQANVTQNITPPNANAGPDRTLTCIATSAMLNGSSSTPGVSYSWSGPGIVSGGNTATPTVNVVGTYTLTVTNPANGCTATDQANVTQNITPPNANAGPDRILTCTATTATLNGSSTTPGVTYSWSGPGIMSGGNTATPTVNAVGTYILTVTNPANGCTATDQANVTQNITPPNVDAGPDRTLTCTATTATLNGSSTTPGVTYSWSGPGIVSGGNTATPTVNVAGTYILTVTNPANGCSISSQVVVSNSADIPPVDAGPDRTLTCTATTATLNGSSTTPGVTYSWSGPGIVSGGNTATPTVNAPGTYTLTVTDPGNSCSATDQAVVTLDNTPPDANAGEDKSIACGNTTVQLTGSSATTGVSASWQGPGIVSGGNTFTPTVSAAGQYILTVTAAGNGCSSTDVVQVISIEPIRLDADIFPNPCAQVEKGGIHTTVSGGSPPYRFEWSNGAQTQDISDARGGLYTLTVTDTTGCTETVAFSIPEGSFSVEAFYDTTILLGQSVQLFGIVSGGSGEEVLLWLPPDYLDCSGCEDPVSTPTRDITYVLTVTDTTGCVATDSVRVLVRGEYELYFPSVFTPNNDRVNDGFSALGDTEYVSDFRMWVFNRWNETVFYSEDVHFSWDGKYKGSDQEVDVFVYAVQATFFNGRYKDYRGILVLLR